MNTKVTIRDIAYLSGVSISTVSRVVSGKSNVNEATRKKVEEVIEITGYEPNYTARALATKNTDTIAVIIDRTPTQSFGNSFFIDVLDAIATQLNVEGKDMILLFSSPHIYDEDIKVKRLIQSNKIDGVIKLSVQENDKTLQFLIDSGTPTVVVGRSEDNNVLTVDNDNVKAMKEGVDYLINNGAKNIAFVAGQKDLVVTIDRLNGYKKSLNSHGISFKEDDIYYTDFDIDEAYKISEKLINKNYDAIASTDDLIAYGISRRYQETGNHTNILTFNNTLLTKLTSIPITTIDINVNKLGKKAVELLLHSDENDKNIIVNTKLITRS